MHHLYLKLPLAALLLSLSSTANAGIYNMQSTLATHSEEGLSGSLGASADWRTGNIEYLQLTATPLARYRNGKHFIVGLATANRRTNNGDIIISRFFEHLRYRYDLSESILGEVFVQHEFDALKRLELRALVGGGPKFNLVNKKSVTLDLGISYMLEYEKLQNDGNTDSGVTDFQHRNSTYIVAGYKLDDRVKLSESVYVQPRLTDANDIRALSESELTFQLTKHLSFTSSFTLAYDSRPPNSIEKLDTTLKSSITFKF